MTDTMWETAAWVAGTVALVALLAVPLACWLTLHGPVIAARLSAATTATRRGDAAAHLGDQDDLVQTLVVATYALQLGDQDRARTAVDVALRQSRVILDRMLAEAGHDALSRGGGPPRLDHLLRGDGAGRPSPREVDPDPAPATTPPNSRHGSWRGPLRRERPAGAPSGRFHRHVA